MPDPKPPANPAAVVPPNRRYPPPAERMSETPSVRALLTGRMTPEKRSAIQSWLSGILDPKQLQLSIPEQLTVQQRGTLGSAPDPTVNLALKMLGGQYPEAAQRSPTLHVAPELDYTTSAARVRQTGHLMLNPLELPDYDAKVVTPSSADWSQKFLALLDTLRHEYSHGMGLGDWPAPYGRPSAYDVSSTSERLHEDVELPFEKKKRGPR